MTIFRVNSPTTNQVERAIQTQRLLAPSFLFDATAELSAPPGYDLDQLRTEIGRGERDFAAAIAAIRGWRQFQLGWVKTHSTDVAIEIGQNVAVIARAMALWSLNVARIVAVENSPTRFGFTYVTLPAHVERGVERFRVELDPETGLVWYDICAVSQPAHILARIGYPLVRRLQARFRRDSTAAMRRALSEAA